MTEQSSKILSFRGASASRQRVVLSPILAELDERGSVVLNQLLDDMWEHADDHFFAMAEQLPSDAKHQYLNALRAIRVDREAIYQQIQASVRSSFSVLLPNQSEAAPEQRQDVAAEVPLFNGTETKDTILAIEGMLLKAEKNYSRDLWILSDGLRKVAGDRFTTARNLPYSPRVIAASLLLGLDELDINADAKLILLKLADRHVFGGLRSVYSSMMEGLRKAGVRLSDDSQQKSSSSMKGGSTRPLAESRTKEGAMRLAANRMVLNRNNTTEQFVPRFALVKVLNRLQRLQFASMSLRPIKAVASTPAKLKALVKVELSGDARNGDLDLSKRDADILGLVSLQFESALEDPLLNSEAATLIAALQLPVLKAALLDRKFFDRSGHPARNLLSNVIELCQAWGVKEDLSADPLYHQLSVLVKNILEGFHEDTSLFEVFHEEFLAIAGAAIKTPSNTQERGNSLQSEVLAARTVAQVLEDRLAGVTSLPLSIEKALRSGWNKFMISVFMNHGADSERWQRVLAVVDGIVASTRPLTTLKQKERLLVELPMLLEDLRSGLSRQGFQRDQLEALLKDIESLNLKRLNEAKIDERGVGTTSSEAQAVFDTVLKNLRVGDWLEYEIEPNKAVHCRLAAVINGSGKYIFVDNAGKRIANWQRAEITALFSNGKLKMLDDNQLFESALGSMVSDVRNNQDKPLS